MAAGPAGRLTTQLRQYFDQLAPTWDEHVSEDSLGCLSDIVAELGVRAGCCVLDIGTGTGVLLPLLIAEMHETGRIIALDISAEMLVQAKCRAPVPTVNLTQADAMAIPLVDHSVDLAICNSAFPHFEDKAGALKEIARTLKDGGRLVVCHTMSRAMVNRLHENIGGVVADDRLPDEHRLREQVGDAGLTMTRFEDRDERYLVIAEKRAGCYPAASSCVSRTTELPGQG